MTSIPGNAFVTTPQGSAGAPQLREAAPQSNPSETRPARAERVAPPQHVDRDDGHRADLPRGSVVDIRV